MKILLRCALLLTATITSAQSITLHEFATGFNSPIELAHSDDSRMYVVEQGGTIKVINVEGVVSETPLLDISNLTDTNGERGLLGLAFHPNYADNGLFYVYYTNLEGNSVIARYTRSTENPQIADPESAYTILTIDQPFANHNGGCLRFGPDGYLYIATGDGGSAGDPNNNAQNTSSLLGKILRIDVDNAGEGTYSIPQSNPFTNTTGADEIWAYGLRNPWKFSFHRTNGDMWIADVGQENIEEINRVPANTSGVNYGWRCFEGSEEYNIDGCTMTEIMTAPVAEYEHDGTKCSITGGYVYTGTLYPEMAEKYVFSDFCDSRIGIADVDGNITWSDVFEGTFATLGEDIYGELYAASISDGKIYKIILQDVSSTDSFNSDNITFYPNPAGSSINLKVSGQPFPLQANIYDLSGKILLKQEINSPDTALNISALSSGIYVAEITGKENTTRQKIIKQ